MVNNSEVNLVIVEAENAGISSRLDETARLFNEEYRQIGPELTPIINVSDH